MHSRYLPFAPAGFAPAGIPPFNPFGLGITWVCPGVLLVALFFLSLAMLPPHPTRAAPPPNVVAFPIGTSVEGREIVVWQIGEGSRPLVMVGAIQGSEGNTAHLVEQLAHRFAATMHLLPPDTCLYLLPVLNPDGLHHSSRYNSNGVDLNRNWDSGNWQPDSVDASGAVPGGGGTVPFSEPETKALAEWLFELRARSSSEVMVLFYHSAYPPTGLVLPGSAGSTLTRAFAQALGYRSSATWSSYPVTGTAPGWCARHGFHCFETELPNRANLNATQVQRHATAILAVLLHGQTQPGQRCFAETGFCIFGHIRHFWEQHGGIAVFGLPITPQHKDIINGTSREVQLFERHRLEIHPEHAPPYDVLPGRIGVERLEQQGRNWWIFPRTPPPNPADCSLAETGHAICEPVLSAWRAHGIELDGHHGTSEAESRALFGLPLSDVQTETLPDGQSYQVQWFERARFEIHPFPTDDAPAMVLSGLLGRELQQGP
jgi:predicted deacylase